VLSSTENIKDPEFSGIDENYLAPTSLYSADIDVYQNLTHFK
jgi:hypothetical protein